MPADITVPTLGESVTTATIARWIKKAGEAVAADEPVVELETDKVTVEVNAPEAGTISEIIADEGAEVEVGALLGRIGAANGAAKAAPKAEAPKKPEPKEEAKAAAAPAAGVNPPPPPSGPVQRPGSAPPAASPLPAAAKMMEEKKISTPATSAKVPPKTAAFPRATSSTSSTKPRSNPPLPPPGRPVRPKSGKSASK